MSFQQPLGTCATNCNNTFHRFYLRLKSENLSNGQIMELGGIKRGGPNAGPPGGPRGFIFIRQLSSVLYFGVFYTSDQSTTNPIVSNMRMDLNKWYCVEVNYYKSSTPNSGRIRAWVGDTLILNRTIDNNGLGNNNPDTIFNGVALHISHSINPNLDSSWFVDSNKAISYMNDIGQNSTRLGCSF